MDNKTVVKTNAAPAPIGPYSQAIRAGNTIYVSGQIALDPQSNALVSGDIQSETEQVMKNLGAILEATGVSFQQVVKCSIFVRDMDNFSAVNQIYGKYFQTNPPARETVEVSRLPKDVNVEISCIAHA